MERTTLRESEYSLSKSLLVQKFQKTRTNHCIHARYSKTASELRSQRSQIYLSFITYPRFPSEMVWHKLRVHYIANSHSI